MKIKPSSYFSIGIMAFALMFGIYSLTYTSMQTKLLPLIVAGIVFILATVELAKELIKKNGIKDPEKDRDGEKEKGSSELFKYSVTFCWIIGLLLAVYIVGFLVGTFLFVLSYLRFHVKEGWIKSATVAVLDVVAIYVIFMFFFKADLFPGVLFGA